MYGTLIGSKAGENNVGIKRKNIDPIILPHTFLGGEEMLLKLDKI